MVNCLDQVGDAGVCHAHVAEEFGGIFRAEFDEFFFDLSGNHDQPPFTPSAPVRSKSGLKPLPPKANS
ncbi:MAG: hypothetical protein OSB05_15180 [Akkermansiaceae bacterium]|nr:hypothetical protein [Akkermansiaceae bacterium]